MEIEILEVAGFEPAIQAMRLPMKSWDKADSDWDFTYGDNFTIGTKDHDLSMKLIKAGSDHRKHIRLIDVWMKITAPLYWWKQVDTYRMGVDKVSESTMHTITKEPFDHMQFETEGMQDSVVMESTIDNLNYLRKKWLSETDPEEKHALWKSIICLLPESYLQTRIVKFSYEALRNIYHARKNHKLEEWREFCKAIEALPYSEFITEEA